MGKRPTGNVKSSEYLECVEEEFAPRSPGPKWVFLILLLLILAAILYIIFG